MIAQPIDALFSQPRTVLVAGAGGGFDVIAGLPIALSLLDAGHRVHLANLSFMPLGAVEGGKRLDDVIVEVDADCTIRESYAPEIGLASWLREQGVADTVYCFRKVGARPLRAAYELLVEKVGLDAVILVDGGVDAVLRGDEHSLGTPTFDHVSVAAVSTLELPVKVLACVGLGAERYDKISHAQALHRFADLAAVDALLGVECYLKQSPTVVRWLDALSHIYRWQGPLRQSIVCDTIRAAVAGDFGEMPVNQRTEQTPMWISPLSALCWYMDLDAVAQSKPYLAELLKTDTVNDAAELIDAYHAAHRKPAENIPL